MNSSRLSGRLADVHIPQAGTLLTSRSRAPNRRRKVAVQVGDRRLNTGSQTAARDHIVHPCPAALAVARIQVEIELADQLILLIADVEEAHVFMPDRCAGRLYFQAIQRLD